MSANSTAIDQRRAQRKRVDFTAVVTNVITGQPMAYLGNLSITGMLLISTEPPRSDAVYQVSVGLPGLGSGLQAIELGIQVQWQTTAASPGQIWAGYRIIAITNDDAALLNSWLELPGSYV
ncbi:PilZ domain-containing protein [Dyella subtropica]|uniref:PilZ domain-containing protein n=1 Tax=Dyella subtropica TaxID=2992127 RepID=UPI00225546DF|nr:PilZ domain-containing protein [Dyella subtropica]